MLDINITNSEGTYRHNTILITVNKVTH